MKQLFIYTLQNCLICNELKGKLKELHIPYKETIIDDGHILSSKIGDKLEKMYITTTYPIVEVYSPLGTKILSFITKTELENFDNVIRYEDINQIINKLKQIYALQNTNR
jgi:glutaredoxin